MVLLVTKLSQDGTNARRSYKNLNCSVLKFNNSGAQSSILYVWKNLAYLCWSFWNISRREGGFCIDPPLQVEMIGMLAFKDTCIYDLVWAIHNPFKCALVDKFQGTLEECPYLRGYFFYKTKRGCWHNDVCVHAEYLRRELCSVFLSRTCSIDLYWLSACCVISNFCFLFFYCLYNM